MDTDQTSSTPPESNGSEAALTVFEEMLSRIVHRGLDLNEADFEDIRRAGSRAAEEGMSARAAVDLYLASAARAWSSIPPQDNQNAQSAAGTMLDGIRTGVPILVEGYQNARQQLVLHEETARREFIDDLLHGDAPPTSSSAPSRSGSTSPPRTKSCSPDLETVPPSRSAMRPS